MGLFDRLFGKSEERIQDRDQLRDAMFAAALAGDNRRLVRLGRANIESVLEHFKTWKVVPIAVRSDPEQLQNYAQALFVVSQVFAEQLGHPELMDSLIGPAESNPLMRWQDSLKQARAMMDLLEYDSARSLLTNVLIDSRDLQGSAADQLLPITNGCVGECYFQTGAVQSAIPHFEHALTLCERTGDAEGVLANLASLFESHRYLGNSSQAADYADRLAQLPGQPTRRWQTRSRIVRAGEPLNRVVAVVDNETLELDQVEPRKNLHVHFVFERNRITLRPTDVLAERGKELGSAGCHEEALAALQEAARADAFDPHCRYLEAFTLLLLEQYAQAAERYRQVEELAPGWFHCRSDAWVSEQLLLGHLDQADLRALHSLEDGPEPPKKKVKLAEGLIARRPGFALGYLHLGRNLARVRREMEAQEAFRKGLDTNPEPDARTQLLVELGVLISDRKKREPILQEAVALNGNLVAGASAALALRTMT